MFRRNSFHQLCSRWPIYAVPFFCACLATTIACCQSVQEAGASDRATMIVLAPVGPVFVDLHLTVSRLPYREWVARFLANDMDADQSGRLDESELNLLTDSMKTLLHVKNGDDIMNAMKASATDVTLDDFVAWLRNSIPRAFDLIAQPQAADNAVRLASLLDTDYDGAISETELTEAPRTLRFRDLDNDETFSVSELLPYRDPRSQNAPVAPDAVSLPFFHVVDHESAQRAAERIMQRYGIEGEIPASLLRQPNTIASKVDSTANTLSVEEIRRLAENPQFHIRMDVSLSVKANTSNIKVAIDPAAAAFCRSAAEQTFGEHSLVIDGLPLKVVALGGSANDRRNMQGFLGQTFSMSDVDRNQYLDESEFAGMMSAFASSGVHATFSSVDLNGDAMVTRAEVFTFAKRDQTAAASRVEVSVKQEGKTLFSILDGNSDRRLSNREIHAGRAVLKKYDFNGDDKFADSELGTEFVLAISLGRPEFRRTSALTDPMAMQGTAGDAILPGADSMPGPAWFRSMDRNQDGDVSPREFLGTTQQFSQIDTDNDHLISADEAMAIQ